MPFHATENQIEVLKDANEAPYSYCNIVELNEDGEIKDKEIMDYQIWNLLQKCQVLALTLSIAKEKMETVQNWDSCCNKAIQQSKRMGVMSAMNSRMIRNWYQDFRVQRTFKMICPHSKHNLLPFLQQNKDICQSMQQYGCEHLHELSMELMCE